MIVLRLDQGILKLLETVYSEGRLQSCLKLRNFQNPFNKDNLPVVELAKLNFTQ